MEKYNNKGGSLGRCESSQSSELLNDCSAFVVIPKNTNFQGKKYLKPKDYYHNSSDNTFTFAPNDIIVRGICNKDFSNINNITENVDDSHTILKVSDFIYGLLSVRH